MNMTSVTVRVDEDTKKQASDIAEDFGFDLSSVTRAFYRQIVRERRIPLNLSYSNVPEETLEALAEARRMAKEGAPRFQDADAMSPYSPANACLASANVFAGRYWARRKPSR